MYVMIAFPVTYNLMEFVIATVWWIVCQADLVW